MWLLQNDTRPCNNRLLHWCPRLGCYTSNDYALGLEATRNRHPNLLGRPLGHINRHANIDNTVEEDSIVFSERIKPWLVVRIRKRQADGRPRRQAFRVLTRRQGRQPLPRVWVLWVFGGAAARDDEGVSCVEDLIGVREDRVRSAAKRIGFPNVDQSPGLVSCLDFGDSEHGTSA